jgi:1,4-dihydroxy-2-naphthoyl-CoA hydrolase
MYTLEQFQKRGEGHLPGWIGLEILEVAPKRLVARLEIQPHHLAPNGFLHAASVIALADTACGYGCVATLPEGAKNFTTVELKTNFLGTVRGGAIRCEATLAHGGRTTQVWDATVRDETNDKVIALFRCTQMILYPKE